MIKVSIIVPVYNVEAYLDRCLNSLVNQTLQDIEIIVVNDGATDRSQEIIEIYAKKSPKIQAYIKENGGLSDARNYGLQYCTGEYIGFVDSDDFVELNMYELLYEAANKSNSDIVECNLFHTYDEYEDIEIGEKIKDKKRMLMFGRSVVWNKIYQREWLLQTKVTFHKGLIYEDIEFYLKLIPYIRQYTYIDEALIHYVQRPTSINNFSSLKTLDILKILKTVNKYYEEKGFYKEYKEALEFFYIRILLCSSFLRMCRIKDKKERKLALSKNWILLNETYPSWKNNRILRKEKVKHKVFMRTMNVVTYRFYSWLFPFIYQIKRQRNRRGL